MFEFCCVCVYVYLFHGHHHWHWSHSLYAIDMYARKKMPQIVRLFFVAPTIECCWAFNLITPGDDNINRNNSLNSIVRWDCIGVIPSMVHPGNSHPRQTYRNNRTIWHSNQCKHRRFNKEKCGWAPKSLLHFNENESDCEGKAYNSKWIELARW